MAIKIINGDLFECATPILVNPVNLQGVMGKGIAAKFKALYPDNYEMYRSACKNGVIAIGKPFIYDERGFWGVLRTIVNFPTKTAWRKPSEYSYIQVGLLALRREIIERRWQEIAMPAIGCGEGKLEWNSVRMLIEKHLGDLDATVYIYLN